jgi:hypothetical protein
VTLDGRPPADIVPPAPDPNRNERCELVDATLAGTSHRLARSPNAAAPRSYTTRRRASAQPRQSRGEHCRAYFNRNALIRSTYCSSSRE